MAKHIEDEKEDSSKDGSYRQGEKRNSGEDDTTAKEEVGMVHDISEVKAGNESNEMLEKRRDGDNDVTGEVTTAEEDLINMDLTSQEVRNFFSIPLSPLAPPTTVTTKESGSHCPQH